MAAVRLCPQRLFSVLFPAAGPHVRTAYVVVSSPPAHGRPTNRDMYQRGLYRYRADGSRPHGSNPLSVFRVVTRRRSNSSRAKSIRLVYKRETALLRSRANDRSNRARTFGLKAYRKVHREGGIMKLHRAENEAVTWWTTNPEIHLPMLPHIILNHPKTSLSYYFTCLYRLSTNKPVIIIIHITLLYIILYYYKLGKSSRLSYAM